MAIPVNVENFERAETDRMFAAMSAQAGGVNQWAHYREPTPIDQQTVIRMNRDTLYSTCVADISKGAMVSIPDPGERYLSLMVVNQDHYINRVLHEPGDHELTVAEFDTPYVVLAARAFVDPADADDVARVNELQDRFAVRAGAAQAWAMPDYDTASFDATRTALLDLAKGIGSAERTFGKKDRVDPVRHLLGTAMGWGGLPETEAYYVNVNPGLPASGDYALTVRDVPVDAFWSISLYNAKGFFEPNARNAYSVNNVTATPNDDSSVTVHFGDGDAPNTLPITEGWNYIVRMYRPRPDVLDGSWTFPSIEAD